MKKRLLLSVAEYEAMGYEKLFKEVDQMLKQGQRLLTWFGKDERIILLPALTALKNLCARPGRRIPIPGQPDWQETLLRLGLNHEQVKKWRQRTASETDIRTLVGEDRSNHRTPPPSAAHVLKQLQLLSIAVLNGDEDKAEMMAAAFAERYEW